MATSVNSFVSVIYSVKVKQNFTYKPVNLTKEVNCQVIIYIKNYSAAPIGWDHVKYCPQETTSVNIPDLGWPDPEEINADMLEMQ